MRYRPGSKIPEDGLIHQNDNVTIVFNHSFDHTLVYTGDGNSVYNSTLTLDDQFGGAPQMMMIINIDQMTGDELFDADSEYIPVMYRYDNTMQYVQPSPVIGIDPVSFDKYAIGIDGTTFSTNVNSGIETHHFVFEIAKAMNESLVYTYGVGQNLQQIYFNSLQQCMVDTVQRQYSIYGMLGNAGDTVVSDISIMMQKKSDFYVLTKIGHFDTIHVDSNIYDMDSPEENSDDPITTIVNLLTDLGNEYPDGGGDGCSPDPDYEYNGSDPAPEPIEDGLHAFLVTRSVSVYGSEALPNILDNQLWIDTDANNITSQSQQVSANDITHEHRNIQYKYNVGLRNCMNKPGRFPNFTWCNDINPDLKDNSNKFNNGNCLGAAYAHGAGVNRSLRGILDDYSLSFTQKVNMIADAAVNVLPNDDYSPNLGVLGYKICTDGMNVDTIPSNKRRILILNTDHGVEGDEPASLRHWSGSGGGSSDPFIYDYGNFSTASDVNNSVIGRYFTQHLFANSSDNHTKWNTNTGVMDYGMAGYSTPRDDSNHLGNVATYLNSNSAEIQNPWVQLLLRPKSPVELERGYRILTWFCEMDRSSIVHNYLRNRYNISIFKKDKFRLLVSYSIIEIFPKVQTRSLPATTQMSPIEAAIMYLKNKCCCDNIMVAYRERVGHNTFYLKKLSGVYPLSKNDKFTVIFNDSFSNPNGLNGYPLVLHDRDYGTLFDGTDHVTCMYRNAVYGDGFNVMLPAPIIGITPDTCAEYTINGEGFSEFDPGLRSAVAHTFVFEKSVFYKGTVTYGSGETAVSYQDMWSMGTDEMQQSECEWIEIHSIPAYLEEYADMFTVLYSATKVGDFDTGGSGGGSGAQGVQGTQGIQGIGGTSVQGTQGVQGIQGASGGGGGGGGSEKIFKTVDEYGTNIYMLDFVDEEYDIIHENDTVTIYFNNPLHHAGNVESDSRMMVFVFPAGVTLDGNEDQLDSSGNSVAPVYYRFEINDGDFYAAPIIGVDPISAEKYAIGLDGLTYPDPTTGDSPMEIHQFKYRSGCRLKDIESLYLYGAKDFYKNIYPGCMTDQYECPMEALTIDLRNYDYRSPLVSLRGDLVVGGFVKIGHFDTLHCNGS